MLKRIIFTTILFIAVSVAPWWIAFAISLVGVFYFKSYYEVIAMGALFDILYGVQGNIVTGYGIAGFAVMTVIFIILERLKQYLR